MSAAFFIFGTSPILYYLSYLLHIESATDICSICISRENHIVAIKEVKDRNAHAAQITLLVTACLQKAQLQLKDLSAVSISSGPGSYTALRVGTSVAKGICYTCGIPLISVDTLQALALATANKSSKPAQFYCPMIDARRMEVYTALYDKKLNNTIPTTNLIVDTNSFEAYFSNEQTIVFCGNGAEKCKAVLESDFAVFMDIQCSSSYLIPIAWQAFLEQYFVDTAYYVPNYFKAPNITKPKNIL